ncbi:MAG TPA: hypothetical protein ENH29_10925 [Bacteroidetes bacterium]|nr:hypothetical protein [Bacteroidota bacterium]
MNWLVDIPQKVVIIGGQAAGCKTAARLARLLPGCQITIVEQGEIISFGTCGLPLFASGDVDDLLDLAKTPWGIVRDPDYFRDAKGVEVLAATEALAIDHADRIVKCRELVRGKIIELPYDALVLATGSRPSKPPFSIPDSPRIGHFIEPADAKKFHQLAQTGEIGSAVILGSGFIGVELAEAMVSLWGIETTLIEMENRVLPAMADAAIAQQLSAVLRKNDVTLRLNCGVLKVSCEDNGLPTVYPDDNTSLQADYVFVCLGLSPNTSLAESLNIAIGPSGGFLTDEQMRTSVPGIWAAGDCAEVKNLVTGEPDWFPLGSLANRQGRTVADSIAHRDTCFPGAVGTSSVKVFDFTLAASGLSAWKAKRFGINNRTVWATFPDRPDYHPEKKNLYTSMIYDPATLKILGFQAAGFGEVTRYVDVVSALLGKNLTAADLLQLEHAYTPPHASPVSPLNHLGAMILAQEKDKVQSVAPDLSGFNSGVLLDVRTEDEHKHAPLDHGETMIPQDQLRRRTDELDLMQPIHVICRRGPRSYEAVRFLMNRGAKQVDYLGGGTAMLLSEEEE